MSEQKKPTAICVLTARGLNNVLADGGSQAWTLDAKRAAECEYVVCVQNHVPDDWGQATAPFHQAFVVGKLKSVTPSTEPDCEKRWVLNFSEYAEIAIPDAWPGNRNPVFYTTLEEMGIENPEALEFKPMPVIEKAAAPVKGLTIAEAKKGLALTFGISPDDVSIIIRG